MIICIKLAAITILNPTKDNIPQINTSNGTTLDNALTLTFVTIGALSLLMLVIAGFRYVISGGDKERMATAKRMIIYTTVGLIVSATAATIVNVIAGRL